MSSPPSLIRTACRRARGGATQIYQMTSTESHRRHAELAAAADRRPRHCLSPPDLKPLVQKQAFPIWRSSLPTCMPQARLKNRLAHG
eukprot:scaffold26592_cov101-Isochrysis_galbana.AAC.2